MQQDNQPNKIIKANVEDKAKAAAERSAIKGDYQHWEGSISYKDLVKFLETLYNSYQEYGSAISLPKDQRLSYFDQAIVAKKVLDFIKRQTNPRQ